MGFQVLIDVTVTVNGASAEFSSHNIFATLEDALTAELHEGVARGVEAKLAHLYSNASGPQPTTETQAAPEPAPVVEGQEPSDPTRTEPSSEDAAALAHAESLRNELRASRQASVESAKADEQVQP